MYTLIPCHLITGEMPDAAEAMERLKKGKYFYKHTSQSISGCSSSSTSASNSDGEEGWPEILKAVVAGMTDGSSELVLCAIGGAIWQLKRSLIDYEVLSMGRFLPYIPPDEEYKQVEDTGDSTSTSTTSVPVRANIFHSITENDELLSSEPSSSKSDQCAGEHFELEIYLSLILSTYYNSHIAYLLPTYYMLITYM